MKNIIISVIVGIVMFTGVNTLYDVSMKSYCLKLQNQAEDFSDNPNYFITQIDNDECTNVYGIKIVAQVK